MSHKNLPPQPHKVSLARRGIKALLPEAGWDMIKESWRAFRESPYYTPFVVGVGSITGTAATAILNRLRGLPSDLLGILIIAGVWVLLLSTVFVFGRLKRKSAVAVDESKSSTTDIATTTKDAQIAARDSELIALKDKYSWLFTIATVQAQDINDYLEITKIRIDDYRLAITVPYIRFAIHITNHSVFRIVIQVEQGRGIVFGGRALNTYPMKVIKSEPTDALNKRKGVVIIEQPLRREEADYVRGYDKLTDPNFYFDGLFITATGGTHFPQVDPKPLAVTVGVNISGGPLTFGGPPPDVDLTQETQASAQPQQPFDLLNQLATLRDEGNEILEQLAKHRVMVPYDKQFEEWRARVQAYLDMNSTGFALRFRSKTVEYQYPKTASANTRELFDKLYTRIMRLEEFIRERSK